MPIEPYAEMLSNRLTRRHLMQCCAGGLLFGVAEVEPTHANDTLSKDVVSYQDRPNGSKRCWTCVHYVAVQGPASAGSCQIVIGSSSPQGYCIIWAERDPTDSC